MPIPIIGTILFEGLKSIPYATTIIKVLIVGVLLYYIKQYTAGAKNPSERVLHGKVAIVTGGTSGVGAAVVRELATRGTQIILLTRYPLSDPFLVDYVDDLRTTTGNELITVEQVDLAELHSIRKFATQWIDNTPPRRLDMLVLCGDEWTPRGAKTVMSKDRVDRMIAVNYLANFHLASILSPALRAQPIDRDVRVIAGMCTSYLGGNLHTIIHEGSEAQVKGQKSSRKGKELEPKFVEDALIRSAPSKAYATSKLALFTFLSAFQKHLSSKPAADGFPPSRRVICVDPGWTRTPGLRRYISGGTLWGLFLYLLTYPLWWLLLKSPEQGAQSFLWAAMDPQFARGDAPECVLVKECEVRKPMRQEVVNEDFQKKLWEETDNIIKALEQRSALKRTQEKRESEEKPTNLQTEKADSSRKTGSRRSRKA